MRARWLEWPLVVAAGWVWFACSSSSGPSVDSSKKVVALSTAEEQSLCDWMAQQYGGYGGSLQCAGGGLVPAVRGPTDQAACVAKFSNFPAASASFCLATAGDFETCVRWKTNHDNLCGGTPPTSCTLLTGNGNCPSLF